MRKTHYDSEAYNQGWLDGYDALVADLHEGFNGKLPRWLLTLIGGKKTVSEALESVQMGDGIEDHCTSHAEMRDYEDGRIDGYEELLSDIKEAFGSRNIGMPSFLRQIVGQDADTGSQPAGMCRT